MPFCVDELTVDDFTGSGWRVSVEASQSHDCLHYKNAFYRRAEEARATGDHKNVNLFALLGDLASMFIDADDPADPLKPMLQMAGSRTAIPSDFDSALPYLCDILPHIDDAELKARIADVLWLRKRDFKAAREAVASYLAVGLGDAETWPDSTDRIERALDIAARANQRDLLDQVICHLEEWLALFSPTEPSFLPARLMSLLLGRKSGDPIRYSALAESLAYAAESRGDWHTARQYWDLTSDWYRLAKNDDASRLARLRSAETYVHEAESRLASDGAHRQMIAVHFLEKAILAFRAVGGQQERIAELHGRLLDHQRQSAAEMGTLSVEFDASELTQQAIERVSGKRLYDAVFALALLGCPAKIASLRVQAERHREEFVFRRLASVRIVNAMGRTVARQDPPEIGETQDEMALRNEMYRIASQRQALQAHAMIEPARAQILREHSVRAADLMPIVRGNPFVPPGREEFFVRGLHAGFHGDYAAAVHFLIPQIENSIRYLLEQHGVITSKLDEVGIQDERDLNSTLRLTQFADPLKKMLGDDLVFDLRGLLIEREGSNLRNEMAHGLLDYEAFYSPSCVHLWWLTLRLCCQPVIAGLLDRQRNEQCKTMHATDKNAAEVGG